MAVWATWKHWGRQFFYHGLETRASQTASVGNINVQSQMIVGGVGSFSGVQAFGGIIASAVASMTGIDAASLSTIRSLIVNQVASLSGVGASSLSTFRSAIVSQVASVGAMIVGSTAGVVTVASNAVVATVSATQVTAAGAILATVQQSYGASVQVASKVAGVSFAVQLTGSADANNAYSVAWAIMN